MLTQDKINKEDWKEKFFERFGGEGTIAKTDENCILIAFTKKEVIDFIETLLKEQRDEVLKVVVENSINIVVNNSSPSNEQMKIVRELRKITL